MGWLFIEKLQAQRSHSANSQLARKQAGGLEASHSQTEWEQESLKVEKKGKEKKES